jgi:hypothetical protein
MTIDESRITIEIRLTNEMAVNRGGRGAQKMVPTSPTTLASAVGTREFQ